MILSVTKFIDLFQSCLDKMNGRKEIVNNHSQVEFSKSMFEFAGKFCQIGASSPWLFSMIISSEDVSELNLGYFLAEACLGQRLGTHGNLLVVHNLYLGIIKKQLFIDI